MKMEWKEIFTWYILSILLLIFFNNLLLDNDIVIVKTTGTSMCPTHGKFSLTLLKEITSPDDLIINNVYVFDYYANQSTQHRLVGYDNYGYYFKGDNNIGEEYVKFSKIKYKTLSNLPITVC